MMDTSHPAAPPSNSFPESPIPAVSIVIPARNEEANLAACLRSLVSQTGVDFEIIVVDDASTDHTREIASSFAGVRVITAEPLAGEGNYCTGKLRTGKLSTGKNNAVIAGANQARANWLLFTDADTVHLPGSLARALEEAKKENADLLSYSPEQVVVSFTERAVMPVIFAELARQYPPHKVRDQKSRIVAANGQYILVRRTSYDAAGGHAAVASDILEDLALARLFRGAGFRVHFRYGGDAVRTHMYRNWIQLREGWTKNLALLFPRPNRLALQSLLLWSLAWASLALVTSGLLSNHPLRLGFVAFWLLLYRRIRISHFSTVNNLIAIALGLPIFAYLLLRSKAAHRKGQVSWKGRAYPVGLRSKRGSGSCGVAGKMPVIKSPELRADN
jgi:glycosyltransferase involved in cell wall biosynthesis